MSKSTHRVIEAADTPASIGPGDLALTITWPDGSETVEHVSERAAALLGYQYPDPQPPAPPAWMVEVAREGCQRDADVQGLGVDYRSGGYDDTGSYRSAMCALQIAIDRGHVLPLASLKLSHNSAWNNGYSAAIRVLTDCGDSENYTSWRADDVSSILSTMPTREA